MDYFRQFTVVTRDSERYLIESIKGIAHSPVGVYFTRAGSGAGYIGFPSLMAVMVEYDSSPHINRHGSFTANQDLATLISCSKREAKRLIYPETNLHKGERTGNDKIPFVFTFAKDPEKARKVIDALEWEVRNGLIQVDPKLREAELFRIFGYINKVKDWPALITKIRGNKGWYYVMVTKGMARKLIYHNKRKKEKMKTVAAMDLGQAEMSVLETLKLKYPNSDLFDRLLEED